MVRYHLLFVLTVVCSHWLRQPKPKEQQREEGHPGAQHYGSRVEGPSISMTSVTSANVITCMSHDSVHEVSERSLMQKKC